VTSSRFKEVSFFPSIHPNTCFMHIPNPFTQTQNTNTQSLPSQIPGYQHFDADAFGHWQLARPQLNAVPTPTIVRAMSSIATSHLQISSVCSAGVPSSS
jgi:hypothetical protein